MQQIFILLLLLSNGLVIHGQTTMNLSLKKELDSLYAADQQYRTLLFSDVLKTKADSVAASYKVSLSDLPNYLTVRMQKVDSSNMARMEEILAQHSYPGKSLVGIPTNEAAFYI